MEAKATQEAPPTPYARPRQPTDSPAASLPTETLTQILDLALQDLKPLERQKTRLTVSNVCKHRWTVAASERELVVHGSKQAHRLSSALLNEEFTFKPEGVRALVISVGNETTAKSSKLIGDLLLTCPILEHLHLTLEKGFSGEYASLGKGLRNAIASSGNLVELEMYGNILLGTASFEHIFTNLLKLRQLVAPSLQLKVRVHELGAGGGRWSKPRPNSSQLQHLDITNTRSLDAAPRLVHSSLGSLRTVRVGDVDWPGGRLVEQLAPAAHRLIELELVGRTTWQPLPAETVHAFVKSLASIRRLTVAPRGLDLGALFPLFAELPTLESLTLRAEEPRYPREACPLLPVGFASVKHYIAGTTNLKHLSVPETLLQIWTEQDLADVEDVAEQAGVEFELH